MTDKKKETKQPLKKVISNNMFLIKLCFMASPALVIFPVLDAVRNQVSIFFEHTFLIGYVLEAAEFGYPFKKVAFVIILLFILISVGMAFTVWVGDYVRAKEGPKVSRKIKLMLYERARELDLECYDNPEYYNEMVLAISEVDNQIERCITFLCNTFAGLATFITTGIYFVQKDYLSITFAVAAFLITFFFNRAYNRLSYKIRVERNPHERKREYVKRVFYLSDYAKEIRLNPEVKKCLGETFAEANAKVYDTEKKYANMHFFQRYMGNYVGNDFFCDVLYIGYLVFKAAVLKVLSFSSVAILYNSFNRLKRGLRVFTDTYPFACETSLYVQKIRNFLEYET
ncbi:MAG: ABC transporter ATP-binding protein, partial [Lachnospiraceae bacterium]|nr:ABC transporter ATP-binding protein [Lachnospiraceae bacterium]